MPAWEASERDTPLAVWTAVIECGAVAAVGECEDGAGGQRSRWRASQAIVDRRDERNEAQQHHYQSCLLHRGGEPSTTFCDKHLPGITLR